MNKIKDMWLKLVLSDRDYKAYVLKQFRDYRVRDELKEYKTRYENYFSLPGAINSMSELQELLDNGHKVYLVLYKGDSYCKGERWCEYDYVLNLNYEFTELCGELKKYDDGPFILLGPDGNFFADINRRNMQSFRYATAEEIVEFQNLEKDVSHLLKTRMKIKSQYDSINRELELLIKKWDV